MSKSVNLVISQELRKRCQSGDFISIKEATGILLSDSVEKLKVVKEDFRYIQGYTAALERIESLLINK